MSLSDKNEQAFFLRRFRSELVPPPTSEAVSSVAIQISVWAILSASSFLLLLRHPIWGCVALPAFLYLTGTRYRALVNIMHECVHCSFTANRSHNKTIAEFLSIICFMRFSRYRENHVTHHIYTGDGEKDLGFSNIEYYELNIPLKNDVSRRHLRRIFTLQMFKDYIGYHFYDQSAPRLWRYARLAYVTVITAACLNDRLSSAITLFVALYMVTPRVVFLPIIGYISDLMDHGGMLGNAENIHKSRNYIIGNRLIAEIFFPRNDCYHLIHHLFPTVPAKWMPKAHAMLLDGSAEYRSMNHSFTRWTKIAFSQTTADPTQDSSSRH